jgi:hypothetical protein
MDRFRTDSAPAQRKVTRRYRPKAAKLAAGTAQEIGMLANGPPFPI